jgi:hypothetical protein
MTDLNTNMSAGNKSSASSMINEGSPTHGHIRDAVGKSVHDIAEEARISVANAVHTAAEKLRNVDAGAWRATEATNSYAHKISSKLEKFSSMLADKDSMDISHDVSSMAKKYQTPLIMGGLALAYLMFRPGNGHRS